MSVMIQIRNVPEKLHRRLKSRAALAGMSLSDYLLQEIRHVAERPTIDEFRARLKTRPRVTLSIQPAEIIRAERERECLWSTPRGWLRCCSGRLPQPLSNGGCLTLAKRCMRRICSISKWHTRSAAMRRAG